MVELATRETVSKPSRLVMYFKNGQGSQSYAIRDFGDGSFDCKEIAVGKVNIVVAFEGRIVRIFHRENILWMELQE